MNIAGLKPFRQKGGGRFCVKAVGGRVAPVDTKF